MNSAAILIALGGILLSGLALEAIGQRTRLPRVTLLLIFGFVAGPHVLGLLPTLSDRWVSLITNVALVMIGFLLGERFTLERLQAHGRSVLWVSLSTVIVTATLVGGGLYILGASLSLSLLSGAIAAATAPAATYDVIAEADARGPFTETLLGIVAIDDAWGLLLFSVALAIAAVANGGDGIDGALLTGVWEIGGALGLGVLLGLPTAFFAHRVAKGEPTVLEALGVVLLCGGVALWLEVSLILAAMALGATTANLATRHGRRPFHAIEGIERPFLVVFFVVAGATLEPGPLLTVGVLGVAFILLRVAGRLLGGWLGGVLGDSGPDVQRWIGVALLPQAGVALGMALLAAERRPELAETLLPLAIGTTVVFEIIGPIATRYALARVGETGDRARG